MLGAAVGETPRLFYGGNMLKDGKFIKEDPPKIGAHYIPRAGIKDFSKEEQFVQSILLGIEERRQSLLSKMLGLMLRA